MKLVIKAREPPDFGRLFELRDMACKIAEEEERRRQWASKKRAIASLPSSRPYKKLRSAEEVEKHRGWVESLTRSCGAFPLVFGEKKLSATDVKPQSNRFLLPKEVKEALLREMKAWEKGRTKDGLPVRVLDRMGRTHEIQLAKWPSNDWLVLKGKNYRRFVESNDLQRKLQEKQCQHLDLMMGVWLFRHKQDDCLCFAVVEFELAGCH